MAQHNEIYVVGDILTDCLIVTTAYEYLQKRDNMPTDKELTEIEQKEYDAIQNILSMEVAIFLTRRTSGCCGSIIDNIRQIRRNFIAEYQKEYGISFIDYNSYVDF